MVDTNRTNQRQMQTNTAANRNGRKDTTPNTVRSTAQTMSGTMKSTNKGDQVKSSLYSRQMLNSNNLELHFNTMHKRKIDHEKTRTIIQENPGLTHIHINRCENFNGNSISKYYKYSHASKNINESNFR